MKKLRRILKSWKKQYSLFLLLLILVAVIVFFLRPLKKSVRVLPWEIQEGKIQLNCETVLGTSIFPQPNWENKSFQKVEAQIHGDKSKIAIEIGSKVVKLLPSASVEIGTIEPLELQVFRNTEEFIVSMAFEIASAGNGITHSFILNKKSGLALWSKSNSSVLLEDAPYNVVSYFRCL